jgi:ribokinase
MKILNFGSLNIDYTYRIDHFVKGGETISASTMQKNIGGKGLNQSVALAKAGAEVYHAGCIGQDGDFLVKYLQENGVNTEHILVGETATGHAIIQLDDKGQNCIIIYGGANTQITTEHIDKVLGNFSAGDVLLMQNEINNGRYIMTKAKEKGMIVVLNPSPVTNLDMPLELVDYFLLNEHEAAALFHCENISVITEEMRRQYPKARFVLTLGEDGVIYIDKDTIIKKDAIKTQVVDTTAAGDTFTGFFMATLFDGGDVDEALTIATKAASVAISRPGAAQSIPYKKEIV